MKYRGSASILALLTLGCAAAPRLPEYAAPKSDVREQSSFDLSDVVGYRPLTREDFLADSPPYVTAEEAKQLGAMTCANILLPDEMDIVGTYTPAKGEEAYSARLKKPPRYVAVMNRRCSWWNAESPVPVAYQLQHEQIHFALAEIAARRLNAAAPESFRRIHATGKSREDVERSVSEQTNQLLRAATAELVERNRQFDIETSLAKDVAKQAEWLRTAERELEELKEHAVPYVPPAAPAP